MDRVRTSLEQNVLKTGVSTVVDKFLSVNEIYNPEDKQLQESFKTKGEKTEIIKEWWSPFSNQIDTCYKIFKNYALVFEEKERTALEIEIKNLKDRDHAQRELFNSMLKDFNQIKNSQNKHPGDLYLIKNL